jgi:alpha-galactosidase
MLDICRDIREVAEPNALLVNYSNPMAMMTWAANVYGGVRCVGLCHGVQGGHHQIAEVLGLLTGRTDPIPVNEVDIDCVGINHQTWYTRVLYRGEDWARRLTEGFERHPRYSKTEKCRIDVMKRFGYYSTESNGHLSEYLMWYRKRAGELTKWIDLDSWIEGETGGYLRHCLESRNWFETEFPHWISEPPYAYVEAERSEEHGARILEALETGRIYRGHFNVVNNGAIPNLPADAIVEVPGYVDKLGMHIPPLAPLPAGPAAICSQSIGVQRLAVLAAVEGNDFLLRQALMLDPLTGAVCTPEEIDQMADEMLVAEAEWLPQYTDAIKKAKARLAGGLKVPVKEGYRGAVRVGVRSVEELNTLADAKRKKGNFNSSQV